MIFLPPDPQLELAQAEATRSGGLVALPVVGNSSRRFSSLAEFADAVRPDAVPGETLRMRWVARADQPLLRPVDRLIPEARRWPLLDFLGPRLNPDGSRSETFVVSDQSPEDRRLLLNEWKRLGHTNGTVPADLKIYFVGSTQMVIIEPDGKQHVFVPKTKGTPFDPDKFAARFAALDTDPVPPALRKVAQAPLAVAPGTETISGWVSRARLASGTLDVDARVRDWRVTLATSRARTSYADVLEAIARAHRLYWRSVGEGRWMLSASPDGEVPTDFSVRLAHDEAMRKLLRALRPLARSGQISEASLYLMGTPPRQPLSRLSPEERRTVASYLRDAELHPNPDDPDPRSFARLQNDADRLSRCTIVVNYTITYGFLFGNDNFGSAISLP